VGPTHDEPNDVRSDEATQQDGRLLDGPDCDQAEDDEGQSNRTPEAGRSKGVTDGRAQ